MDRYSSSLALPGARQRVNRTKPHLGGFFVCAIELSEFHAICSPSPSDAVDFQPTQFRNSFCLCRTDRNFPINFSTVVLRVLDTLRIALNRTWEGFDVSHRTDWHVTGFRAIFFPYFQVQSTLVYTSWGSFMFAIERTDTYLLFTRFSFSRVRCRLLWTWDGFCLCHRTDRHLSGCNAIIFLDGEGYDLLSSKGRTKFEFLYLVGVQSKQTYCYLYII